MVGPQVVTLRFPADGSFRLILIVGAGLAVVLVAWALLPARRRRRKRPASDRHGAGDLVATHGVTNERKLNGVVEPAEDGIDSPRSWSTAGCWAVLSGCLFVIAGPVALVVPLVVGLRWVFPRRLPSLAWLAFGSLVLAGIGIAIGPGFRVGTWVGSGSFTVQALGGVALAALVSACSPHLRNGRFEQGAHCRGQLAGSCPSPGWWVRVDGRPAPERLGRTWP